MPERSYEERKEVPLFKFDKPGATIEGVLVRIEPAVIKGKKSIAYYVRINAQGDLLKILGTWQINQKLRPDDLGRAVKIRYEGEDKNVFQTDPQTGEKNYLRNFKVGVDIKTPRENDLVITDADIPF